jgi:hypothetical protein
MNRTGAAAMAVPLILAGCSAAQAQMADLTRATCAQLMDLPRNDRGQLIVWLHGYYAGAAQRAVLDRSKLEDAFGAVQQLCERNRAMPLMGSEARSLFLGEAPAAPPLPPAPPAGPTAAGQSGPSAGSPAR